MNHPLFAVKHEHICPPYVNTSPRPFPLSLRPHHHLLSSDQKAIHNYPSTPQLAMVAYTAQLSTYYSRMTYAISFMHFINTYLN